MPTLGDVIRQQRADQPAAPQDPAPPPPPSGGVTVGDVVRQGGAARPVDTGAQAGSVVGKALAPTDGGPPLREPTWGETIGLGAARVVPPLLAGAVTTPFLGPAGGLPAAALAGTLGDVAAQRYERAHGLRREVRPYQSVVTGATAAIPGIEIAPEAGLVTRAGIRAAEGAGINVGATTAETGLEEHRLPTLGDVSRAALTGAVFGGVTGTAEHGVHAYVRGRGETPTPTEDIPPEPPRAPTKPPVESTQAQTSVEGAPAAEGAAKAPTTGETLPAATPTPPEGARVQAARDWATRSRIIPKDATDIRFSEDRVGWINAEGRPEWRTYPRKVFEAGPAEAVEAPPGGAPPPPTAGAEPSPPPTTGARPEEPPPASPYEQPSFRKVPGLHEAAYGTPPMAARVRDPERLAGEIAAVDRNHADLPEQSRDVLKQVIVSSADDIAHQARETQPVQRTMDLANELVFDPAVAAEKARGQVWKAEELHAAGSHIGGLLDEMDDLAGQIEKNPTDDALKLKLQKKQQELVLSVRAYEGAKAETGRGLNILKYQQAALYKGDAGFIKQALKYGANADDIVAALRTAKTDQEKMRMLLTLRSQQITPWQYLRSYWMSNVLSGVKTQLRNAIGNTMAPITDVVTTPLAAGVERLRGTPLAERQTFAGEVPYKLQALRNQEVGGMRFGLREAIRQASDVFTHGYERGGASWELPPVEWTDAFAPNLSPTARRIIHAPTRALSAADTFFRTLNYHMDVYGGAFAQAKRELGMGASSEALQQRVTDILSRPDLNPELFDNAARSAQRRVYQEPGKLDKVLLEAREIGPLGFVIPFIRTPVALVRQGMQATPLGFLSALHGGTPTARMSAQIRGEAAFGSMLMSGIAMGLATGEIQVHGTGPRDPVERDQFYREGHRPNSVEIAGHDVGYSVLGPLALPISVMANYFDAYRDARAKGDLTTASDIAQKAASDGTARAVASLKDQSFVRGLSDLNSMLSDPEHQAARFFGSIASGFVPYSGAVRSVAQATDPTLRQAETPQEVVETGIPGMGQNVPPRIRATGEPIQIQQAGGALGRALLPMDVSAIQSTPVEKELDRLGVRLTMPRGEKVTVPAEPGKGMQRLKLSREDSTTMQAAKGQATMLGLEDVISQPEWPRLNENIQRRQLEAKIAGMRKMIQARAAGMLAQKKPLTVEGLIPEYLRSRGSGAGSPARPGG